MRIYELIHSLYDKFVPTDEIRKNQMRDNAATWYGKILLAAKDKIEKNDLALKYNEANQGKENFVREPIEKISIKEKIVVFCDNWFMNYIFGILYVFLFNKIGSWLNNSNAKQGDEFEEDEEYSEEDIQDALKFLSNRKKLR